MPCATQESLVLGELPKWLAHSECFETALQEPGLACRLANAQK